MRISHTLHLSISLGAAIAFALQIGRPGLNLHAIPAFVMKYAPLVYLDQNELYLPSDIQAQLNNTYPALNYTALPKADVPAPLLLSNLEQVNILGNCNVDNSDACPIYLTSKADITTNPSWLYGVLPNPVTGQTVGARSCAIIVNDHRGAAFNRGIVDAYYMYFYAFNLGETIAGTVLGNHVGDWEHSMVRFQDGVPISAWLSQHDYGQAFAYSALSKNGTRPIIYSAIGSHANFAVPGLHSRNFSVILLNDTTSAGPLWDPLLSAYFYDYEPSSPTNGTFTASSKKSHNNTGWLYFAGKWGDEQYPDSDPRQNNFGNLNITWTYESGPTGPLDKQLNRTDVCPSKSGTICSTLTALPEMSGTSVSVTVTRTYSNITRSVASKTSSASTTGSAPPLQGTAGKTPTPTPTPPGKSDALSVTNMPDYVFWGVFMVLMGWLLGM